MTEAHIGIILAIGTFITAVAYALRKGDTPPEQAKRDDPDPDE